MSKPKPFRFTIEGRLPGLNDYTLSCRNSRFGGNKAKRDAEKIVKSFIPSKRPHFNYPVKVNLTFYEKDMRRDFDNIIFSIKFIMDALVEEGVLENDSRRFVAGYDRPPVVLVDKTNPRIEVEILSA